MASSVCLLVGGGEKRVCVGGNSQGESREGMKGEGKIRNQ